MPSSAPTRRIIAAIVAVIGLVLFLAGLWFAVLLGPQGTATFSTQSSDPVVITPSTLNRVSAPVTVTASSSSGPVFVAAALPQDATDAIGSAKHAEVVVAQFPSGGLELQTTGSGAVPDVTGYHVWRSSGQGSLTITQDQGPQSVVVFPTKGGQVDVTVSVSRRAWFLLALGVLVVGLLLLGFAGYWLWSERRRRQHAVPAGPQAGDDTQGYGETEAPTQGSGETEAPAEGSGETEPTVHETSEGAEGQPDVEEVQR